MLRQMKRERCDRVQNVVDDFSHNLLKVSLNLDSTWLLSRKDNVNKLRFFGNNILNFQNTEKIFK